MIRADIERIHPPQLKLFSPQRVRSLFTRLLAWYFRCDHEYLEVSSRIWKILAAHTQKREISRFNSVRSFYPKEIHQKSTTSTEDAII